MKTFTLLLFIINSLTAFSQSWFDNNPTWVHRYSGFGILGYEEMSITNDTIINGQVCKAVRTNLAEIDVDSPSDTSYFTYFNYAFEEGKKVYLFSNIDNNFHLIYDFEMEINDTLILQIENCDQYIFSVLDTGLENINGELIRYQKIKSPTGFVFFILEGIGFVYRETNTGEKIYYGKFNFTELFNCAYADPTPYFRCYSNDNFSYNPLSISCYGLETVSTTYNKENKNDLEIYPVPTTTKINYRYHSNSVISTINIGFVA